MLPLFCNNGVQREARAKLTRTRQSGVDLAQRLLLVKGILLAEVRQTEKLSFKPRCLLGFPVLDTKVSNIMRRYTVVAVQFAYNELYT